MLTAAGKPTGGPAADEGVCHWEKYVALICHPAPQIPPMVALPVPVAFSPVRRSYFACISAMYCTNPCIRDWVNTRLVLMFENTVPQTGMA
jgi:hypothetical protein